MFSDLRFTSALKAGESRLFAYDTDGDILIVSMLGDPSPGNYWGSPYIRAMYIHPDGTPDLIKLAFVADYLLDITAHVAEGEETYFLNTRMEGGLAELSLRWADADGNPEVEEQRMAFNVLVEAVNEQQVPA